MSSLLSWLSGAAVLTAVQVLLVVVALIVAPRNRRPAAALAWILLIALLPVIGVVLFAVIGSPKLPRNRRDNQRQISHLIEDRTKSLEDVDLDPSMPRWLPSVVRLNQTVGAMPLLAGNTVQLVTGFADQLAALVAAVDGARRHVHVEFYILSYDATTAPFFAALHHAIERGVTVRVLLDHLGSRPYPGYRKTRRKLTRIGARWHLMLPVQPWKGLYQRPDLRNHRKLMVVDGDVGFVGSLNLIDPSYDKRTNRRRGLAWKDLLASVHGPAVREIDALFVTDWHSETDELLTTLRGADCPAAPAGPVVVPARAQRAGVRGREQPGPVQQPDL